MSNLGSGSSISDELFVGVPLSAVIAELKIETGHKGSKHTSTLGEQT